MATFTMIAELSSVFMNNLLCIVSLGILVLLNKVISTLAMNYMYSMYFKIEMRQIILCI